MTDEQARVATIIETTECPACGAAKKQPCTSPRVYAGSLQPIARAVWCASVHYVRRDQAARVRNQNIYLRSQQDQPTAEAELKRVFGQRFTRNEARLDREITASQNLMNMRHRKVATFDDRKLLKGLNRQ